DEGAVLAIKALLNCTDGDGARYCGALDRFNTSTPLAASASGVWVGSGLAMAAGEGGKVAELDEGVFSLFLKNQTGAFYRISPDDEAEGKELQATLAPVHEAKAPSGDSSVMKQLAKRKPPHLGPIGTDGNSLSFQKLPGAELGIPDAKLPDYAREP